MIRDLLNPSSGFLDLREDSKGVIQVAGITEVSTINAQEVGQPPDVLVWSKQSWLVYTCWRSIIYVVNFFFVCFLLFRSWSYWWRATSSALRSRRQPIRRPPARTPCCRWPSSSRAAAATCCRRSASHASSWSTWPALNGQRRWALAALGCCAGLQFRLPETDAERLQAETLNHIQISKKNKKWNSINLNQVSLLVNMSRVHDHGLSLI